MFVLLQLAKSLLNTLAEESVTDNNVILYCILAGDTNCGPLMMVGNDPNYPKIPMMERCSTILSIMLRLRNY